MSSALAHVLAHSSSYKQHPGEDAKSTTWEFGTAVSTRSAARPPGLRIPTKRVTASTNRSVAEAL